ncbi:ankyrin repeat-containing protein [Anaeramoeba ignava]|uniref:Ankyrin repeat-containing protein n=1 Tax=Anaeramoeba ignava TaxID=1746090 RepID=A0A9Q0LIE0_ANAIG|nr:ankyrin repeat-containing protein [Anaeramoeba ignava]
MENQVKIFSNLTNKNEKFAKKYLHKITNNYEEIVNYKEEDGSNLLHQATQKFKIGYDSITYRKSGIKINSQNKKGKSPLHIAVAGNMYDIIELFIENKADIDIQDKSGCTPLFIAVEFGFYKIAELLLKNNANFHLFSKKLLPIHLAARNNNSSLVELLLNHGADPNTISQEGKTAYHYTHSIFVQKILRSKMNPLNFPNYHLLKDIEIINEDISFLSSIISSKFSGLDLDKIGKFFRLALSNRYLGQIKSILQKFHFQNYRDQYENSLLYYAILENNNLLVKLILENGGNPNIIGAENKSPLHIAAELGNVPAILLLLNTTQIYQQKDSEKPIDCARNQVSNFILSHFQQKIILKTRKKSNKDIFNDLVSEFSIFINCWIDMNKIQVLHQIGKGINGKSYLGKWESKDVVIKIVEDLSQPNLALEQKYYNEQMEKNVKIRQKSNVEENINSFFDSKRNFSGKHFFGTFYGYFIDHEENGKAHLSQLENIILKEVFAIGWTECKLKTPSSTGQPCSTSSKKPPQQFPYCIQKRIYYFSL